jgi:tetratricopeptide (TPR) repeat protein
LRADGCLNAEVNELHAQIERSLKRTKIAQLAGEAGVRLQAGELQLALQKVDEALALDAHDVNALALRAVVQERRNDHAAANWRRAAMEHERARDYEKARVALGELLAVRQYDEQAILLLSEIEVRGNEAQSARADCENGYANALRAYDQGEFATAIAEIDEAIKILDGNPEVCSPERERLYRELHAKIVREKREFEDMRDRIRQRIERGEYAGAQTLCSQAMSRYPGNDAFPALQVKTQKCEARDRSLYIAEICQAVEGEPHLEKRAAIWAGARERYPAEALFQEQHKIALAECDLADLLTSKARQYRDREQFPEALELWHFLWNIYPEWAGLESEIALTRSGQVQQARSKERTAIIRSARAALDTGAYSRAAELARQALAIFPTDPELREVELLAHNAASAAAELAQLFSSGLANLSRGDVDSAVGDLEAAIALNPSAIPIRSVLVSALARKLERTPENSEEARAIGQRIEILENQRGPIPLSVRAALQPGKPISRSSEDVLPPTPEPVRSDAMRDSLLYSSLEDAECPSVPPDKAGATAACSKPRIIYTTVAGQIRAAVRFARAGLRGLKSEIPTRRLWIWAVIAGVALLLAGISSIALRYVQSNHVAPPARVEIMTVHITTEPSDAQVAINGKALGSRDVSLRADRSYDVQVSRQGYQPSILRQAGSSRNWHFALRPQLLHIRVFTSESRPLS